MHKAAFHEGNYIKQSKEVKCNDDDTLIGDGDYGNNTEYRPK